MDSSRSGQPEQEDAMARSLEQHAETLVQVTSAQQDTMQRIADEQMLALTTAMTAAIERNMANLMEELDVKLEERLLGIADVVAERVAPTPRRRSVRPLPRGSSRRSNSSGRRSVRSTGSTR